MGESQRTLGENKGKFYKLKVDKENLREKTPILCERIKENGRKSEKMRESQRNLGESQR